MKIPVSFSSRGVDQTGELNVPVEEAALVLVDMWNWHDPPEGQDPPEYLKNAQACLTACRSAGMTIIHAPNWPVAHRYAQHEAIEEEAEPFREKRNLPEHLAWPPRDSDIYQQASAMRDAFEFTEDERQVMFEKRAISRYLLPEDEELVLSTHNAFHYALWQRGIKLLIYIGGALNVCMLHRDTGLNRLAGSDGVRSNLVVVVLEDCVYAMPSDRMTDEEAKQAMLDYYKRKIAFTASSKTLVM